MKLKKIAGALLSCAIAGTIFTGCGNTTSTENSAPQEIKIGMIKNLNAAENLYNDIMEKIAERTNVKLNKHQYTFYDSLTMMQMGLDSGSIQEESTYKCVADYLMSKNPKVEISANHNNLKLIDNFAFAMRTEDTELKNSVDTAVEAMRQDGTLENLTKTYITDLNKAEDPPAVAFENFDGAESIKIGVTGDLPPLDFVSADGKAAGFNTALLSELGKRLEKNIEVINIDSAARAAALTSKTIDISFWAIIPTDSDIPGDIDKPQGVELSAPYFKDEIVHIELKK
jgi:polar amino acid transport system substrate-binding protein